MDCGDSLENIERVIREPHARSPDFVPSTRHEAMDYAEEQLFERESVVNERVLLREALVVGRGSVDLDRLREEPQRRVAHGALIRHEDQITSRDALGMEAEFIYWARSDWDKYAWMGDERAISSSLKGQHRKR